MPNEVSALTGGLLTDKRCKAKTKSGEPCGGFAVTDSDYCFTHSPEHAAERAAAHRAGGFAHAVPRASEGTPPLIRTMADVLALVNAVVLDSWELPNTPARAGVLLRAAEVATKVLTAGELADRVEALERLMREKQL